MFLEEQIRKLKRRIGNIERDPRPEFLRCNKLRYEIELERFLSVQEAWGKGKPFAALLGVESLAQPLGFEPEDYIDWGDRVTDPQKYLNIAANKLGFPEHTCDRTIVPLGLLLSGEVPMPRLMTSRRTGCDPIRWSAMAAAKYAGVLFFGLDRRNNCGDENICSLAEQLAELIEFARKSVPGIGYDEDRLIELLEMDHKARTYMQDTYELRKRRPCPISPQDAFRLMPVPSRYPNSAKVLEYCRLYHDELFERAEKSVSGTKEEKLRIAWLATAPYGRSTSNLLTAKGVSLTWFHYGVSPQAFGVVSNNYGDDAVYGHKLSPLQEVVRQWTSNVWGAEAELWIDSLIKVCREVKVDAVVDFLQVGCVTTNGVKTITSQRLKDELGIPTLDLQGREFFATEAAQHEMNRKLEEFLDMCIANKK